MQHPKSSSVENSNDLVRLRVDDDDLVTNQDKLISPPMWLNLYELRRHRIEVNVIGHPATNRDREVDVRYRLHTPVDSHKSCSTWRRFRDTER
jgi:hypothetical protein